MNCEVIRLNSFYYYRNRINPFLRDNEVTQSEQKDQNGPILDPLGAIPVQNHSVASSQSKAADNVQTNGDEAHDNAAGNVYIYRHRHSYLHCTVQKVLTQSTSFKGF